ncbi:proline--tRNA ligase [Spirochaetia bacterium]|nr:proline--tRNA ligase [Spirochaetia bacterium]
MSVENAREYLNKWNRGKDIIEMPTSTATVADAASSLGVIPARIAKSISLKNGSSVMIVVAAGDVKIDNKKFKAQFGFKPCMLSPDAAFAATGYKVGGVCPFGIPENVDVYLDISMKRFETVFPACGNGNSCIELNLDELNDYSRNKEWIDVCKSIQEETC